MRLPVLVLLAFLLAGCGKGSSTSEPVAKTVNIQVPAGTDFVPSEDGQMLTSPAEMSLIESQGKALTIISSNVETLGLFLSDEEGQLTGSYVSPDDNELRPGLGELFFVTKGDTLVVPTGASRILFATASDDDQGASMKVQEVDAPPVNNNLAPTSTQLVRRERGKYISVERSAIGRGQEFFVEAVYAREPLEDERSLRLTWDGDGERWVVLTKTVMNPKKFRSGALVMGRPGENQ